MDILWIFTAYDTVFIPSGQTVGKVSEQHIDLRVFRAGHRDGSGSTIEVICRYNGLSHSQVRVILHVTKYVTKYVMREGVMETEIVHGSA